MSKQTIQKEIKKHLGELVIDLFEIVRLEGFNEDEDDYYYVFRSCDRGRFYSSCVGYFIPLKGKINDELYKDLERIFNLNIPKKVRGKKWKLGGVNETL